MFIKANTKEEVAAKEGYQNYEDGIELAVYKSRWDMDKSLMQDSGWIKCMKSYLHKNS